MKPAAQQPDLFDAAPLTEALVVSGWELGDVLEQVRCDGGHVESISTVPGFNGRWKLITRRPEARLHPLS